ncbi:MAG: hypothetical protein L3J65_09150 [Robiginitomaculum sp.]|nr:hypothetical protein [Robiginitomaculum sp.]
MKLKYFVIGVGLISVAMSISGCKDERDAICALTWEQAAGPGNTRVYAGQGDYYLADMDGDGWIIEPEFNNYCQMTEGLSNEQLLLLKPLAEEAQSIGQE